MDYRFITSEDKKDVLKREIESREKEHFALVNGTVGEQGLSVIHQEGETAEQATERRRAERIAEIQEQLPTLYTEYDALDG